MTSNNQPIACTLGSDELRARRTWIADLTREALLGHQRNNLVLHLRYKPQAARRVREMVRLESVCCAFLKFEIHKLPDEVSLTITASEAAREAAGAMFDQLVATAHP
jgi:hypothetical protein